MAVSIPKVSILQSRLRTQTLRRMRNFFSDPEKTGFPVAVSIPGLLDAIIYFADGELVGT